jgi:hypothetical protein
MPVPKAIREAAEAADAQVAAIIAAESAPLVVDPVTGEPYITTAAPATPPTPPAPPQDDWEQRFRTLQGKYDSELPVLRSQISNYERINNTLSQQLASLTEQVQTLSTRPVAAATAPADAVTSKDVEQYGAELIDVINRVAEARAQALTTDLRGEIARLQTSVSRDVAGVTAHVKQTDRALYDQKLTEAVPDWRTINIDPEWLRWLGEYCLQQLRRRTDRGFPEVVACYAHPGSAPADSAGRTCPSGYPAHHRRNPPVSLRA